MNSGGAQQLRRGDRVQIKLDSSYRHYLDGLFGTVNAVLHHGVIVELDSSTPQSQQRVLGPGGAVGPANPPPNRAVFQFHEVVKLP